MFILFFIPKPLLQHIIISFTMILKHFQRPKRLLTNLKCLSPFNGSNVKFSISTVFLTNLDLLRHRTVPSPSSYRTPTVTVPYPTVPHRTSPYLTVPTVFKFFKAKKRKKRWVRWGTVRYGGVRWEYGTVTVRVRYGDANGINSLEIL